MQGGAGCKHDDENGKSEIEFSNELKESCMDHITDSLDNMQTGFYI